MILGSENLNFIRNRFISWGKAVMTISLGLLVSLMLSLFLIVVSVSVQNISSKYRDNIKYVNCLSLCSTFYQKINSVDTIRASC